MGRPVTITVHGEPVGKGRARMTRSGHAYTPARTRSWESLIRLAAQQEMGDAEPMTGAARLDVLAVYPIPRSWSQRKRDDALAGVVLPAKRPDLDNVLKACLDALNTVVVADDAQVVEMTARKRYGLKPMLVATVSEVGR